MVWFTIAMWLFGNSSYTQVFRWLHRFDRDSTPSSSALTQARKKIGISILASIYHKVVKCLCCEETPGAFYSGMRMVAVDGFVRNVPDSDANRRAFGRPKNGTCFGAFPQIRVVSLCEVGSRAMFGFLAKPLRCGETTMAERVYQYLPEKSLLLFDIAFCSYKLMKQIIDQRSDFIGRAKPNRRFKKIKVFGDGSYLSKIYACDRDRRKDRNGTIVRVIDYTLNDSQRTGHQEPHRLVTTLLDEKAHPAETLIVLYHERWEEEIAIDEVKTHLRKSKTFRSESPIGVIQELYGMLIAHFIIRKLAFEAAAKAGVSPRRISFTGTVNVLQARLPEAPRSRQSKSAWYDRLIEEISLEVIEKRRNRINPRVIKKPQSKWPKKRDKHRKLPKTIKEFWHTIVLLT